MKELNIMLDNDGEWTVEVKNCGFMEDSKMKLFEFKKLCFKNNWEGTLHRILRFESIMG